GFVAGVDLQRRRLLSPRTDQDAVADRDDRLLLGIAGDGSFVVGETSARAEVLALMAEAAGALADAKAPRLAEIVPPGKRAARLVGFVGRAALAEGLRMHEGRRFQRK